MMPLVRSNISMLPMALARPHSLLRSTARNYSGHGVFWRAGAGSRARLASTNAVWKPRLSQSSHSRTLFVGLTSLIFGWGFVYVLYPNSHLQSTLPHGSSNHVVLERVANVAVEDSPPQAPSNASQRQPTIRTKRISPSSDSDENSAWGVFANGLDAFSKVTDLKWASISDGITDFIVPDWAKAFPGFIHKIQQELSMAPGSLADEIWQDARDPSINPEILYEASVRVSRDLCPEEKDFLAKRRKVLVSSLAKYLDIREEEIHPDDVPCIAMVGSGGGLRALVSSVGSFHAASEAGLFQCATYTAGVSGSTWLQALYYSSLSDRRFDKLVAHLKARLGTHIAYPPVALAAFSSAPTNKFLLSGFVEKLKGDPQADYGLVDIYGLLLAARLLVPRGELEVNDKDLKISNQRVFLEHGSYPLPIYTAVRHEIPITEESSEVEKLTDSPSEATKKKAKEESWFQWFEITPYEMFCEEFSAGIPTWAMGRRFQNGKDISYDETGLRVPELRLTLLLGIFGSAFCATLAAYYKEIRPILKGLTGFSGIDELIEGRNDDLSKLHPIDPASIPNFCLGMEDTLPKTTTKSILKNKHLDLMDAGMSNNLPIYPLLRPGRDVDIVIAFDASADVRTDNWLSVVDGYARQRGIKGWPIGAGWPKETDSADKSVTDLEKAQAGDVSEVEQKLEEAKSVQRNEALHSISTIDKQTENKDLASPSQDLNVLGYCTVWVGTKEEREHTDRSKAPPPKVTSPAEEWQLMEPNAGITVIYFPFLSNPKVEGVDPMKSPYMSTWNFVYTPENIENVIALARTNFEEGQERTKRTIRAVYERKKKLREGKEQAERQRKWEEKIRRGIIKNGEGDHFS